MTSDGRRFGARPNRYEPPDTPPGRMSTTDLDSRNVKTPRSYTQGYNAQAVVNEHQVVLAAEVTLSSPDFGHLQPMVEATSGYWHEQQMDTSANACSIPADELRKRAPLSDTGETVGNVEGRRSGAWPRCLTRRQFSWLIGFRAQQELFQR